MKFVRNNARCHINDSGISPNISVKSHVIPHESNSNLIPTYTVFRNSFSDRLRYDSSRLRDENFRVPIFKHTVIQYILWNLRTFSASCFTGYNKNFVPFIFLQNFFSTLKNRVRFIFWEEIHPV